LQDRLNFFQPYERKAAGHEDQLTRALLIVLRLCPMAHAAWLRLVDPKLDIGSIPSATFVTQKREIPLPLDEESEPWLISVFLAPERPETPGVVEESDRSQVLDAIIDYNGSPVVVVENKIVVDSDFQALNVNTGERIRIEDDQEVVVVRWRDLIETFSNLLEKDLVGGGERVLLQDFLDYVEDNFEDLGPFRQLSLCNGAPIRVNRRLRLVLQEATGRDANIDRYGPTAAFDSGESSAVADRVYLEYWLDQEGGGTSFLSLSVYPADTLTQARAFYPEASVLAKVRELASRDGWKAEPNFHFGHMRSGLCWTTSTIGVDEYIDYWAERIAGTGAVVRAVWDDYWEELIRTGIASERDWPEFKKRFVETKIQKATPRPGIRLQRNWDFVEAEALDSKGALVPEVRSSLESIRFALSPSSATDAPASPSQSVGRK
jgi:hypothetical protein